MTTKWEVSEPNGRGNGYRISGCNAWIGYGHEEAKANVKLISAAPDLLEMLIEHLSYTDEALKRLCDCGIGIENTAMQDLADRTRALIAKATGETNDNN
jgi:hypothetical protein